MHPSQQMSSEAEKTLGALWWHEGLHCAAQVPVCARMWVCVCGCVHLCFHGCVCSCVYSPRVKLSLAVGGVASPVTSRAQMWCTSSLEHGAIDVPSAKCHRAKGQVLGDFSHPSGSRALGGLAHTLRVTPIHPAPFSLVQGGLWRRTSSRAQWSPKPLAQGESLATPRAAPRTRAGVAVFPALEWAGSARDRKPPRTPRPPRGSCPGIAV